jgi:phosphoribulokinase
MLEKIVKMSRSQSPTRSQPVMLAIAGDSASGKTTLARGLTEAIGEERCLSLCADDYHRYDRAERADLPLTTLHPDCDYLDILEQHLQLLALGRPVLKPVYDHATGTFGRPAYVEPREFVVVEGLHPLQTKLMRACFDATVFLDPPEEVRHGWKVARDTGERGYTPDQVLGELARRAQESAAYTRSQRRHADIVVRFAPAGHHDEPPGTPLSAEVLLRPTIQHTDLTAALTDDLRAAMHLKILRDVDGTPTDCLHVHGYSSVEDTRELEQVIWGAVGAVGPPPAGLGALPGGDRSEPLAITQLILLFHLLQVSRGEVHEPLGQVVGA